jgi:type I site-specific restriction-modification system R (restriction) subunit
MWLTGFDAPSLHTMYIDKPMHGHGLMQAIARVNRVFKDKPGSLVVDYLGLAQELKQALATYTESGGTGRTALDQDEAMDVMLEKHEVCTGLFHGFDRSKWTTGTPPERLGLLPILSEEFLAEVVGMPQRNLAVELLEQLLKGELAARRRKNIVQARSFAEMLEQTIRRYRNRAIEAAQVIEELIGLAKDMREAHARGDALKLSDDELALYDELETNDSAVKVLGDDTLRTIAQQLVKTVRANVTIDWTLRENVRAQLRVLVKRILRKYGYPPDKQEKATQTVLEQAALLSAEWAVAA